MAADLCFGEARAGGNGWSRVGVGVGCRLGVGSWLDVAGGWNTEDGEWVGGGVAM